MSPARKALGTALAAVLAALPGCAAVEPGCQDLCRQLVTATEDGGCGYTTWPDAGSCARGCSDELYRRPDAGALMGCYEAAASACNDLALLRCRVAGGPVPDASEF
ncbi:hypothetical protein L6R50_14070 [Myxococcota bacterium]|nr:hypothetical protein [Myxococcota bacterium]